MPTAVGSKDNFVELFCEAPGFVSVFRGVLSLERVRWGCRLSSIPPLHLLGCRIESFDAPDIEYRTCFALRPLASQYFFMQTFYEIFNLSNIDIVPTTRYVCFLLIGIVSNLPPMSKSNTISLYDQSLSSPIASPGCPRRWAHRQPLVSPASAST